MRIFVWSVPLFALASGLVLAGTASASPRSERVAARVAERAYARQAIAEARAAQAEARVAQIAPLVPVPPPPRPATVRRLARAGVPLPPPAGGPQPVVIVVGAAEPASNAVASSAQGRGVPPAVAAPPGAPAGTARSATPQPTPGAAPTGMVSRSVPVPAAAPDSGRSPAPVSPDRPDPAARPLVAADPGDVAPDGTRSVLVVGEEPEPAAVDTTAPTTDATIELLPVPEAR